jgi:hypothetical protein
VLSVWRGILPEHVRYPACAADWKTGIFIVGGEIDNKGNHSQEAFRFDYETLSFEYLPPMSEPLRMAGLSVVHQLDD